MKVYHFKPYQRIKEIKVEISELKELSKAVKTTLNTLTKFDKYNKIRKITGDLIETYQDLRKAINTKEDMLLTLEIRKCDEIQEEMD